MLLNITLFFILIWTPEVFGRTLKPTPDIDSVIAAASEDVGRTAVSFRQGEQQSDVIIELDIVVKESDVGAGGDSHTTRNRQGRKRRSYSETIERWPNATMYYQLADSFAYPESFWSNFMDVLEEIHELSCVRIVQRERIPNYVKIGSFRGCWSWLGMKTGMQELSLSNGCHTKPTIIHEILHALGFKHEQSRPDRDAYIRVLQDNMLSSSRCQFQKMDVADWLSFGSPYDYKSIMHYGAYYYSMNGERTIETVDSYYKDRIGKYTQMSREDIFQLNKLYNCPPNTKFDLTASEGEILSPRYPDDYPSDIWREWKITVPSGKAQIRSLDLDLEDSPSCKADSLEVFDGHTISDPSLGKFCGSTSLQVLGSGRRLMVRFSADEVESGRGFKLSYSSVDGCGTTELNSATGTITSPGFPIYPNYAKCKWIITASQGNIIELSSLEFHIEDISDCDADNLVVKDGHEVDSPVLLKACGNHSIHVTTSSNKMMMHFRSDGGLVESGFKLVYRTRAKNNIRYVKLAGNCLGNAMGQPERYSQAECEVRCTAMSACLGYSFYEQAELCLLKYRSCSNPVAGRVYVFFEKRELFATQPTTEPTTSAPTTPTTARTTPRTTSMTLATITTIPICRAPQLKDGEVIEDRLGVGGPWTNIVENLIIKCKPNYISATSTGVMACIRGNWVIHRDIVCLLASTTTIPTTATAPPTTPELCRAPFLKEGEIIENRSRPLNGIWTNVFESLTLRCDTGYTAIIPFGFLTCTYGNWVRQREPGCTRVTTTAPTTITVPPTTPALTRSTTLLLSSALCRAPSLKDGEIIESRAGPLNGMWTNAFESLTLRCDTGYAAITPLGFLTCTYGNWVRERDPGCTRVSTRTPTTTTAPPTTPEHCRAPSLKNGEIIENRSGPLNGMWTNAFESVTLGCDTGYTAIIPLGFLTCTYGNWVRQRDPGCTRDVCTAPQLREGEIIESRTGGINEPWTNEVENIILSCDTGYTATAPLGILSCTYGNWARQRDPGCINPLRPVPCRRWPPLPANSEIVEHVKFGHNEEQVNITLSCEPGYDGWISHRSDNFKYVWKCKDNVWRLPRRLVCIPDTGEVCAKPSLAEGVVIRRRQDRDHEYIFESSPWNNVFEWVRMDCGSGWRKTVPTNPQELWVHCVQGHWSMEGTPECGRTQVTASGNVQIRSRKDKPDGEWKTFTIINGELVEKLKSCYVFIKDIERTFEIKPTSFVSTGDVRCHLVISIIVLTESGGRRTRINCDLLTKLFVALSGPLTVMACSQQVHIEHFIVDNVVFQTPEKITAQSLQILQRLDPQHCDISTNEIKLLENIKPVSCTSEYEKCFRKRHLITNDSYCAICKGHPDFVWKRTSKCPLTDVLTNQMFDEIAQAPRNG